MKGCLALEDGRVFTGMSFGAEGAAEGEIVFNTSMTGYQEILTDPSYNGQIITMTYPLIGNYGINAEDLESAGPHAKGFVVREFCPYPSSHRSTESLQDYLRRHGIVALSEIDTRAVTKHIRQAGAMRAVIASGEADPEALVARAAASPGLVGRDLVCEVTSSADSSWTEPCPWELEAQASPEQRGAHGRRGGNPFRVVAYDFGMKRNIARYLVSFGCEVTIVPAATPAEAVLERKPDGVFLSNGPGDPEAVMYAARQVRILAGRVPVFGICLGHQLIGLAFGGKTFKLKFGHRGANQPVQELSTGTVEITSQNHGFAVDPESLAGSGLEVSHINLNDRTVEGLTHRDLPVFCVQYHPEASAGPRDPEYLFARFTGLMERNR